MRKAEVLKPKIKLPAHAVVGLTGCIVRHFRCTGGPDEAIDLDKPGALVPYIEAAQEQARVVRANTVAPPS